MTAPIYSLALALTLAAASLLGTTAAHAQTGTPQSPYVITAVPYTITKPGYYLLGNNVSSAQTSGNLIEIQASNVTLDLNGFYVSGPVGNTSQTTYGVHADGRANLVVQNGTIANCHTGVRLGSSTGNANNRNPVVRNMVITACYYSAAWVENYTGFLFTNNRVSGIGGGTSQEHTGYAAAVSTSRCTGAIVSNNTITSVNSYRSCYGIFNDRYQPGDLTALNNAISNISVSDVQNEDAEGITNAVFALGNTLVNVQTGFFECGKYKDNLTFNVGTPYVGGTAVGTNN